MGMASDGVSYLGMRAPPAQKSKVNLPPLFPTPRKISETGNSFILPQELRFFCTEQSLSEGITPCSEKLTLKHAGPIEQANLHVQKESSRHPEAYSLELEIDQLTIKAETASGVFRALSKVFQIFQYQQPGTQIPGVVIEDAPSLNRRGFMLDISRCKVPTIEELFRLIDLLALIGYNELQLYIEHTFRFKDHETVWKGASPLSAGEIQQIDGYCSERFIELVPNLNSFGHFERWLCHEPYKHMAECPDGFVRQEPYMKRDHGTTLKPDQESLNFIDSLYSEYLPNFSSKSFNVGLDEPWELGQGWSKQEVEQTSKGAVYLRHLEGIRALVEKHGKNMQFWSDVLLEDPENAMLLDKHASPIIWGYEPSHPYKEQAKAIAECGLKFCLAPGTATWRSFTGRWPTARDNIGHAIENARQHDAEGILLTSWGDCGNHQPWPTQYPGILHSAQMAWAGSSSNEGKLGAAIDGLVFGNPNAGLGKLLLEIGRLDEIMDSNIPNSSLHWWILFPSRENWLQSFLSEKTTRENLNRGIAHLSKCSEMLGRIESNSDLATPFEELKLGLVMARISLERGVNMLESKNHEEIDLIALVEKFESIWRVRARSGGLKEASDLLAQALS
jgi:hexosaminidase